MVYNDKRKSHVPIDKYSVGGGSEKSIDICEGRRQKVAYCAVKGKSFAQEFDMLTLILSVTTWQPFVPWFKLCLFFIFSFTDNMFSSVKHCFSL